MHLMLYFVKPFQKWRQNSQKNMFRLQGFKKININGKLQDPKSIEVLSG